jgi:hypothetical protein
VTAIDSMTRVRAHPNASSDGDDDDVIAAKRSRRRMIQAKGALHGGEAAKEAVSD